MHNHQLHRRNWFVVFLLASALLLAPAAVLASEPAGRVLTTKGDVTATDRDDFERPLSRNDVVYPGETLRTGPDGRVQVRFRDDGLVDVKPDSVFEIERYQEATEQEGGSAVMNLLKGALRTITGTIGHDREDEYAVETPVATIGIRGTDYSLEFCDAACAGNDRAPGLYGRVDDGSIVTETGTGRGTFDTDDYFFVPQGGAPQRIIAPPEGILIDADDGNGHESSSGDKNHDTAVRERAEPLSEGTNGLADQTEPTYRANDGFVTASGDGGDTLLRDTFVGTARSGTTEDSTVVPGRSMFVSPDSDEAYKNGDGKLTRIETTELGTIDLEGMSLEESGITDVGGVAFSWGRWAGTYQVGSETVSGGFAYAYADAVDLTSPSDITADLGTTQLSYTGAGPSPVASDGGTWAITDLTLDVDFTAPEITGLNLELSDGVNTLGLSGGVQPIEDGRFGGALSGELASGNYSGGFVGQTASGALLAFDVSADGGNLIIEGLGLVD